ncbi:BnaA06g00820D [Brassica napus]|uniref:BnaA06g00820D protein n=2 Tax=Brassica TaxID=3705 RepID=A0A078GFI4_BRANA|nr:BnaA06g00820D [Brassica napus]
MIEKDYKLISISHGSSIHHSEACKEVQRNYS